ncbi:hypothetical protein PUN28_012271 [Cardiocondyla obscurior]|uniref:Secreted protein n=1 Tax=Cardiocondyla obscurior TaxID=286306 RepID=A0AAW2FEC6_9HYME
MVAMVRPWLVLPMVERSGRNLRMVVWLVSVMVVVGGGSGRDEVVVELWRKRKQHIEQTRKDKCAQLM